MNKSTSHLDKAQLNNLTDWKIFAERCFFLQKSTLVALDIRNRIIGELTGTFIQGAYINKENIDDDA